MSDRTHDTATGTPAETAPVRPDEQMDWVRLAAHLRGSIPEFARGMTVEQFPGGSANLTYLARCGDAEFVIRRPPLGPVAPGAHDMVREYRVLSKLGRVWPVAPLALHLCEDEGVIGARFIVVERRRGVVIRDRYPDAMLHHPSLARRVSFALIDAMADMHLIDAAAAGLGDLGKPDGFVPRQLAGWRKRWDLAKDADVAEIDAVHARLAACIPAPQRVSIVHNDLKIDNCQFDPADPDHVRSVFDWDMATLGDPLIDVGTLLGYWPEPGDPAPRHGLPAGAADPHPTRAELVARYAARTGLDLATSGWYEAFAMWKTAIVLQQIYIRWKRGQTQDPRFEHINERIAPLLAMALQTPLQ